MLDQIPPRINISDDGLSNRADNSDSNPIAVSKNPIETPVRRIPFSTLSPSHLPKFFEDDWVALMAACTKNIKSHYYEELYPSIDYALGQLGYYKMVEWNMKDLLRNGFFLRGELDENVTRLHSSHPTPLLTCSSGEKG